MDILRYLQHCDEEVQLCTLIDDVEYDFGWKPLNSVPKVINEKVIIGGRWNLPGYPGYMQWTEVVAVWSTLSSSLEENYYEWFEYGQLCKLNENIEWTHWRPYITVGVPYD